jgi:hypothetical protein
VALPSWCIVFSLLIAIYEGRLFVLFCSYEIHQTGVFSECVLGVFGKLLTRSSAWAWFHDVWTCRAKVLEYWMMSSLKIKLNCLSWQFERNWNVPLVLLERSWWAGFNGIKIWIQNVGDILISKWFLLLKIQINSKKPSFWRKNQLRMW